MKTKRRLVALAAPCILEFLADDARKSRIGYAIAEDEEQPIWNEGDFFGDKFGNR